MEVSRQPPNPSLLTRARHSHHIIIRPAVEFGQRDILLAQQSRYLRAMISRMVDGLDQDEDGWDSIDLSIIGKLKYLARIELFRDRDQSFTALTSPSPQFVCDFANSRIVFDLRSVHVPASSFLAWKNRY